MVSDVNVGLGQRFISICRHFVHLEVEQDNWHQTIVMLQCSSSLMVDSEVRLRRIHEVQNFFGRSVKIFKGVLQSAELKYWGRPGVDVVFVIFWANQLSAVPYIIPRFVMSVLCSNGKGSGWAGLNTLVGLQVKEVAILANTAMLTISVDCAWLAIRVITVVAFRAGMETCFTLERTWAIFIFSLEFTRAHSIGCALKLVNTACTLFKAF